MLPTTTSAAMTTTSTCTWPALMTTTSAALGPNTSAALGPTNSAAFVPITSVEVSTTPMLPTNTSAVLIHCDMYEQLKAEARVFREKCEELEEAKLRVEQAERIDLGYQCVRIKRMITEVEDDLKYGKEQLLWLEARKIGVRAELEHLQDEESLKKTVRDLERKNNSFPERSSKKYMQLEKQFQEKCEVLVEIKRSFLTAELRDLDRQSSIFERINEKLYYQLEENQVHLARLEVGQRSQKNEDEGRSLAKIKSSAEEQPNEVLEQVAAILPIDSSSPPAILPISTTTAVPSAARLATCTSAKWISTRKRANRMLYTAMDG